MCEQCDAKVKAVFAGANVIQNDVDAARVRELLETIHEICKRNGWPFLSTSLVAERDGFRTRLVSFIDHKQVEAFGLLLLHQDKLHVAVSLADQIAHWTRCAQVIEQGIG